MNNTNNILHNVYPNIEVFENEYDSINKGNDNLAKIALSMILAQAVCPEECKVESDKMKYSYYTSKLLKAELDKAAVSVNKELIEEMYAGENFRYKLLFNIATPTSIGNNGAKCEIILTVTILKIQSYENDEVKVKSITVHSKISTTHRFTFGECMDTEPFKRGDTRRIGEKMKDVGSMISYISRYCLQNVMSIFNPADDVELADNNPSAIDKEMKRKSEEAKKANSTGFKAPIGK